MQKDGLFTLYHYNKDEEAIEITLDYSMKGHPED